MPVNYYLLSNNIVKKYYYAVIDKRKNEDKIYIGGINDKCFVAIINKKDNSYIIQEIKHSKKCALYTPLKQGVDNIIFLQICISFVFSLYPEIDRLSLIDNSYIQCKQGTVSLPDFYFIKHGVTWYELYLFAHIDKKSEHLLDTLKEFIINKLEERLTFSKKTLLEVYFNHLTLEKEKRIIRSRYHKGITIGNFIYKFIEDNIKCFYYYDFFNSVIGSRLQGFNWYIDNKSLKKYNISYQYKKLNRELKENNLNTLFLNYDLKEIEFNKKRRSNENEDEFVIDYKDLNKYD